MIISATKTLAQMSKRKRKELIYIFKNRGRIGERIWRTSRRPNPFQYISFYSCLNKGFLALRTPLTCTGNSQNRRTETITLLTSV
jgi:hypothetical protein